MAESPLYFVDLHHDLDDCELDAWQKPGEQPLPKLRIAAAIADEVSHGGFADYGPDHDSTMAFLDIPGQGNLPLLAHLGKCAFSENVFNRRMIARGLIDILRDFSNNEEDFLAVTEIMVRLSEDAEPTVRTELMEQIPPIAVFLQENRSDFPVVLSEYLTPIVLRYLADPNSQIICKVALVLSKNTAQRLLLPRICDLCGARKLFQVPKVRAANFGDICHAVGQEATEKFLIPELFELCSGNVWGMRKACTECSVAVPIAPPPRSAEPSCPLFIRLISDPCRRVHQAAFQSLGPFISTFASPSRAGFYIGEDGTLSI